MSCPSRELVFQTLEKLIRERKIYQTANGYFVVTPDTFRFMTSAAPQHLFNPSINLDALIPYDDTPGLPAFLYLTFVELINAPHEPIN